MNEALTRSFFHFRTRSIKGKIRSLGGVTVLVEVDKCGNGGLRAVAASAICSLQDTYNKEKGRIKAAGRLVSLKKRYPNAIAGHYWLPRRQVGVIVPLTKSTRLVCVAADAAHAAIDNLSLIKPVGRMDDSITELRFAVNMTIDMWDKAKAKKRVKVTDDA